MKEGKYRGTFNYIHISELCGLVLKTYGNYLMVGMNVETISLENKKLQFLVYFDFVERNEESPCNTLTFKVYEEGSEEILTKYLKYMWLLD